MISTKKLIKMARKWRKIAAASRKRIHWSRPVTENGHFVIYTSDKRRFMIPLTYLKNDIFTELFQMAEEEFGAAASGPIVLPCDSTFMEYAISMIQRHVAKDLEKALIMSLATYRYSSLSNENEQTNCQLLICSF
ncbi:auxin-responsive protein SAUR66-like [Amaranthus tricolor]|uniref:auxin-responsive protein SAUR66-like n=1 Tax=Amaranthus tricolor TaxID=29722 RepID=UPI002585A68C|nr:auxin-responsive protein SAUR66-like [Amaranthus tricolor]